MCCGCCSCSCACVCSSSRLDFVRCIPLSEGLSWCSFTRLCTAWCGPTPLQSALGCLPRETCSSLQSLFTTAASPVKRSTFIFASSSLLRHGTVTIISKLLRSHLSLTVFLWTILVGHTPFRFSTMTSPVVAWFQIHASSHMHVNFPSAPPLFVNIFTCCACDQEPSPQDGEARTRAIPLKTEKETRRRQNEPVSSKHSLRENGQPQNKISAFQFDHGTSTLSHDTQDTSEASTSACRSSPQGLVDVNPSDWQ